MNTLNAILKGVSRSFYLSMRILPKPMRETVSLAYLIARAADTLCDTEILAEEKRLLHLQHLRTLIENKQNDPVFFEALTKDLGKHTHTYEVLLTQNLSVVMNHYVALPQKHFLPTQKVLMTLTSGMVEDLTYFSDSSEALRALQSRDDTDRYTYQVAGCVGEFWTDLLIAEMLPNWPRREMIEKAIAFGKGLQLINILRDLPKDLAKGRSYLSEEILHAHGLEVKDLLGVLNRNFLDSSKKNAFHQVYQEMIEHSRTLLGSGMDYVEAIPRCNIRLRLAVLWPLFIGLRTLQRLEKWPGSEDFGKPTRISRQEVYRIITATSLFAANNTLLNHYFKTSR